MELHAPRPKPITVMHIATSSRQQSLTYDDYNSCQHLIRRRKTRRHSRPRRPCQGDRNLLRTFPRRNRKQLSAAPGFPPPSPTMSVTMVAWAKMNAALKPTLKNVALSCIQDASARPKHGHGNGSSRRLPTCEVTSKRRKSP